ncbi:uncharacterized protein [Nicotiana tomentosiformis]|uniref:uncharacterized protein n=1 Tax=Nicotiana tomentosiformis TaxID=4098 RepID=UPI00388CB04A
MENESKHFVVRCDKFQRYANNMQTSRIAPFSHITVAIYEVRDGYRRSYGTSTRKARYHPAANGQAESTNKIIITNIKKRLEKLKGRWPEVLSGVLWDYRTTMKINMGETPFLLVYGAEALISAKIGESSTRYTRANEALNEEELLTNLDLTEERREAALVRMAAQKLRIK